MDLLYSIKSVVDILLESAEVGLYLSETVVAKSKMRAEIKFINDLCTQTITRYSL